jgi:hypothetical protein
MCKKLNSFVLYSEIRETVKKIPKDAQAELFMAILDYANGEDPKIDNLIVELVFEPIKNNMSRLAEKWEEIKEKRSEAGRIGGIKSGITRSNGIKTKQNEAKGSIASNNEAKGSIASKIEANEAVNVNVNANVNANVNVNGNVNAKEKKEGKTKFLPPSLFEIEKFISENNLTTVSAKTFFNFYEGKKWKVGANQMQSWQNHVLLWEARKTENTSGGEKKPNEPNFYIN